jgi:hypothetical protein
MLSPIITPLQPIPAGWQALHCAILSDGSLIVAVADVDLASEWDRIYSSDGAADAPSRIGEITESGRAQLLTWGAGAWRDGPVFPLETPHPVVDRFSDGRWLVVGACMRGEPNARILAPDGSLLSRFMLGDGIEHIAIDSADRIWVGWYDEGVAGNRGWQVSGHQWPPSSNGVACFSGDGQLIEAPLMPDGVEPIQHCYALTADGSGVWVCPYTDFSLLRFVPGEPARWWREAPAGLTAIAVDGCHALLADGYNEDAARLMLVKLEGAGAGDRWQPLVTSQLPLRRVLPRDRGWSPVWERADLLTGRGDTLHLIDNDAWWRWRVADVVAALDNP